MLPAAGLHVPGMASLVLCLLSADPSGQAARSLRTCKQCWATHSGSVTLILDSIRGRTERSIPACSALLLGTGIGWALRSFSCWHGACKSSIYWCMMVRWQACWKGSVRRASHQLGGGILPDRDMRGPLSSGLAAAAGLQCFPRSYNTAPAKVARHNQLKRARITGAQTEVKMAPTLHCALRQGTIMVIEM